MNGTQNNIHLRQIGTNKFPLCADNNTTLCYDMEHKVSGGGNMDDNEKKSKMCIRDRISAGPSGAGQTL